MDLNHGRNTALVRPLGAFEEVYWLLDRIGVPKHFTLAAHVEGETTVEQWRHALDALQDQQPAFRAFIAENSAGVPCFWTGAAKPIPLRVVDGTERWQQEMVREMGSRLDASTAPMVRATLLHAPDRVVLLLAFQHSAADGLSGVHALTGWVRAAAGQALEPLSFLPSQEESFGLERPLMKAPLPAEIGAALAGTDLFPDDQATPPHVQFSEVSAERTAAFTERARHENASVTAALGVVALEAVRAARRETSETSMLNVAVDTRKAARAGKACATYFVPTDHQIRWQGTAFWDRARAVKDGLAGQRLQAGMLAFLGEVNKSAAFALTPVNAQALVGQSGKPAAMLTNLGRLDIEPVSAHLSLEAVWGPGVSIGIREGQMLGAATTNGILRLLCTSYDPIPTLLADTEAILSRECGL